MALYLDKGVSPVCSLCDVQGPGDKLSKDRDCVLDQTVSESLVLHLGKEWACTMPACATEPGLGLTPVTLMTKDNLMVRNALDHNQVHEGHRLGIKSALYNVYGRRSVGESEHAAFLG